MSSFNSQTDESCAIRVEDATLVRGTTTVFSNLTLHLNEPRIGLIGDNGAGKSSLFRMLCGLDAPQSGSIRLWGKPLAQRPAGAIGMMFQSPDEQIIFPTVEEELALSLSGKGFSRRDATVRAQEFLDSRGLSTWASRAIGSLSQGQRQHVCWLALLIASPRLLLLDEPFSSLDLPGQAMLHADIEQVPQQVIVSTHVLEHVRHFERVIWLDGGQVRADGLGRSVCAAYEADIAQRIADKRLSINDRLAA